jgi:hypothetical protein
MLLSQKIIVFALISVLLMSGLNTFSTCVNFTFYPVECPGNPNPVGSEDFNHIDSHVDEFTPGISYGIYKPFYSSHSYSLPVPFSENKNVSGIWQPPKSI